MMKEAEAIAGALGVSFPMSLEERIRRAGAVGAHRTSMRQDLDAGRPIELEALLGGVIELGHLTGCSTETLESVYRLARSRARLAGCLI